MQITWKQKIQLFSAGLIARCIYRASRFTGLGEGSNIPGKIVLKIFPDLLNYFIPLFKNGWILITGTNGKTTTTKILVEIMKRYNFKVVTNYQGANLISGIVTSLLLAKLNFSDEFAADYAVFEIDEAVLTKSFTLFQPGVLVITNFSRDQLDRYGEINTLVDRIIELLTNNDRCKVILNGNDPYVTRIGRTVNVANRLYFGIKETGMPPEAGIIDEKELGGDPGLMHIPELDLWAESIQVEYLKDSRFVLRNRENTYNISLKLPGVFNVFNALAAASVCQMIIDPNLIKLPDLLTGIEPSFGRSEHINYHGVSIFLFLVKNPVSFNHIIQMLRQDPKNKRILLLLNDLTADGKDISWIWDVSLENLWKIPAIKEIITSGTRAGDMALRIKYSADSLMIPVFVEYSVKRAFHKLARKQLEDEDLLILANYTAMIKFRPYLLKLCR